MCYYQELVSEHGLTANTTINSNLGFGIAVEDVRGVKPNLAYIQRVYFNTVTTTILNVEPIKAKRIARNTGNFLAPMVAYSSGDPIIGDYELQNGGFIGGVYGLQRTGRKAFNGVLLLGQGLILRENLP